MFVKESNWAWYCNCGNNKFTIKYRGQKLKISDLVRITWNRANHTIRFYNSVQTLYYMVISTDEPIEEVIDLFNQQIEEQIQSLYEPGGEKYKQSEEWIANH
jgi:hypothetical protein